MSDLREQIKFTVMMETGVAAVAIATKVVHLIIDPKENPEYRSRSFVNGATFCRPDLLEHKPEVAFRKLSAFKIDPLNIDFFEVCSVCYNRLKEKTARDLRNRELYKLIGKVITCRT